MERVKKKKIGGFLRSLNSPEYIANQFTRYAFNESSLFDAFTVLEGLTVQDLQQVAKTLLVEEKMSVCQVLPKNEVNVIKTQYHIPHLTSLTNGKMRVLFSYDKRER